MNIRRCGIHRVMGVSLLLAGLISAGLSIAAHAQASAGQITVLYDAFGKRSAMEKGWGYSAFIEYGGKRILFDTGDNPDILARNARAAGVDLSRLDFVVLSHRHGDHMGGMDYLLRVNPDVTGSSVPDGLFGAGGRIVGNLSAAQFLYDRSDNPTTGTETRNPGPALTSIVNAA